MHQATVLSCGKRLVTRSSLLVTHSSLLAAEITPRRAFHSSGPERVPLPQQQRSAAEWKRRSAVAVAELPARFATAPTDLPVVAPATTGRHNASEAKKKTGGSEGEPSLAPSAADLPTAVAVPRRPADGAAAVRTHHAQRRPAATQQPPHPALLREALWNQRCEDFSAVLHRIDVTLRSHLDPLPKCHQLVALHQHVVQRALQLHTDTCEAMVHAMAYVPRPAATKTPPPFLNAAWDVWRHLVATGGAPSERMAAYLMMMLAQVPERSPVVETRAHEIYRQLCVRPKAEPVSADEGQPDFVPSHVFMERYLQVLERNGCTHIAVELLADFKGRLQRQPSAGMCAAVLRGLLKAGQHAEALLLLGTFTSLPFDVELLNAALLVLRHSGDPQAAVSAFRATVDSGVAPDRFSFGVVLEAMAACGDFHALPRLVGDLRRFGVKLPPSHMILVADGFRAIGRDDVGQRLVAAMARKAAQTKRVYLERRC